MKKLMLCLLLLLALISSNFAGTREADVIEHQLSNGLKILTVEMHNAPIIFSQLSYKVGSRNEQLGKTGIAHITEHMMFKGTPKFSKQVIKKLIKKNGGVFNAYTATDMTAYWEQVPKNKIDIVLEIESERMQNCLMDGDEFLREREVVIEERHMRTDDTPRGIFREELNAIAFKSHPRQNPVIGWPADIEAITIDDVKRFYKMYYTPNNATLVLVGDFETGEIVRKVEKYFGDIPRGPEVPPVIAKEIEQTNIRQFTIRRPDVKTGSLTIAFHGPGFGDPDFAPLFLARQVLTGFRFSRLKKIITHDRKLARSINFIIDRGKDPGLLQFRIQAFVGEQHKLDEAKEILFQQIERMQKELISNYELQKIRNNFKHNEIFRNLKISSIASRLSSYETYYSWKHIDEWYHQLETVTREDIQRVMNKYFDRERATYGYLLPGEAKGEKSLTVRDKKHKSGHNDEMVSPELVTADLAGMEINDLRKDIISPIPFSHRIKQKMLGNGITIYGIEDHNFPIFSIRGFIETGNMPEEKENPGVANVMGALLNRGTEQHTFQQLTEYKEFIPISFSLSAGNGYIRFRGKCLTEKVDSLLTLGKEMTFHPVFPQEELNKYRKDIITRLKTAGGGAGWKTSRFLFETVYQDHPYGQNPTGTPESLQNISREQLIRLHKKYLRPEQTTITIFGDFNFDEMVKKLDRYFGSWKNESPFVFHQFPEVPKTNDKTVKVFTMPGKKQVDIRIGYNWIPKNHVDENGLDLMSYILGGSALTSRLGEYIRDQQGLAYGIRCDSRLRETGGIWWIGSKTEPANVKQLIRSAFKVMKDMKDNGVSDQELHNAKSYLLRILPMYIETPLDLDGLFAEIIRTHSPLNSFDNYFDDLISIDKEKVNELCRKYIDVDNYVIVVAGDVDETILDEFRE